jgi:hypothetical protein
MGASTTLNVYLPAELYREIAGEAKRRGKTKGGVVRERLAGSDPAGVTGSAIADLFGVADDLPADLSRKRDNALVDYGRDGLR